MLLIPNVLQTATHIYHLEHIEVTHTYFTYTLTRFTCTLLTSLTHKFTSYPLHQLVYNPAVYYTLSSNSNRTRSQT
ncbi:hypothetical protein D3C76_377400 [compost metagenome]